MKYILTFFMLSVLSCSSKENNSLNENNEDADNIEKKIKTITWDSKIKQDFVYQEDKLKYATIKDLEKENNPVIDSTKYEYNEDEISGITQILYYDNQFAISKKKFTMVNDTLAEGSFIKEDSNGKVFFDLNFKYTFNNEFITSYTEFEKDGNLSSKQIIDYDKNGNLISWRQIEYLSNNKILSDFTVEIIDWNNNGIKIKNSPPWAIETLPGYTISNNYFSQIESDGRIVEYPIVYDDEGYIVKYDLLFGSCVNIEYY